MIIVCDYDGTITETNDFPEVGKIRPEAIEVLNELKLLGHHIILYTCRNDENGTHLSDAIQYCKDNGLEFHSHNMNLQEHIDQFNVKVSEIGKPYGDVYIDDKNLCGFPGWEMVRKILIEKKEARIIVTESMEDSRFSFGMKKTRKEIEQDEEIWRDI